MVATVLRVLAPVLVRVVPRSAILPGILSGMATVRETQLPGVGVRHDFTTEDGTNVAVLVHRDGRRELLVYDREDPDSCTGLLFLSQEDTQTMAELLGASQVTQAAVAVQQQIEGLSIEWIPIGARSPATGTTIADGQLRTRTGASVVALIRGETTIPAPGPEQAFAAGDVVVAVGTTEGLRALRGILQG
jgi:TrkA domain protein